MIFRVIFVEFVAYFCGVLNSDSMAAFLGPGHGEDSGYL